MKNGNGRCVYPNGDIYKGGFIKDKRSGAGIMLWKDGRIFKGLWFDDKIKGKGIFKVSPSNQSVIIDGTFENGVIVAGPAKI